MNELMGNATISAKGEYPTCQDTGVATIFVELGNDVAYNGESAAAIQEGVRKAYVEGFLRKSIQMDPLYSQTNTRDNTPANIVVGYSDDMPSDEMRISVIQKGGGCGLLTGFKGITPAQGKDGVKQFVVDTVRTAGGKPCPPVVVSVGIDSDGAQSMIRAQKASLRRIGERDKDPRVAAFELEILDALNALNIGPQGFGGKTTAYDVHVNQGHAHLVHRLVSVDIGCNCVRHQVATIKGQREKSQVFFEKPAEVPEISADEATSEPKKVTLPLDDAQIANLKMGDMVSLSGTIYTARDAAHKRLVDMIERGEELPFDLKNATIYYVGPTPTRPGNVIGSCGPTTSARMDPYSKILFEHGVKGTIGKGPRGQETMDLMKEHGCVYFAAIGGAAASAAASVVSNEPVAFEDLGAEAIRKLEVKDWVCTVAVDSFGKNIFEQKAQDLSSQKQVQSQIQKLIG
jgi:fumarate hydratase class I